MKSNIKLALLILAVSTMVVGCCSGVDAGRASASLDAGQVSFRPVLAQSMIDDSSDNYLYGVSGYLDGIAIGVSAENIYATRAAEKIIHF